MGKDRSPQLPTPPDPLRQAQGQTQAARTAAQDTLRLNALDRTGPGGSATFTRDASGVPTGQTISLSPNLQQTFDRSTGAAANLAGFLPQDRFQLSDVPQGIDLQNNFFNQQQSLLDQPFQDQIRNFEIRAAERGLPVGSEAFGNALDPIARNQALALQQAAFGAVQLTPQEEQRQIQNALLERQLPFQEAQSALGIANAVPQPGFAPQPQAGIAAPNLAGLQQQQFTNQQANLQNQFGLRRDRNEALGGLAGAAGGIVGSFLGGPGGAALGSRLFE